MVSLRWKPTLVFGPEPPSYLAVRQGCRTLHCVFATETRLTLRFVKDAEPYILGAKYFLP